MKRPCFYSKAPKGGEHNLNSYGWKSSVPLILLFFMSFFGPTRNTQQTCEGRDPEEEGRRREEEARAG
jgi:hypothetical protein